MSGRQNSNDPHGPRVRRVLIVEDEPAAREATQRYLSSAGYAVDAAADAPQALAIAAERRPDVAVCDWRLGSGGDGVSVARELQQRYAAKIILVTAHPLDELHEAAQDISVAGFFKKPLSPKALAERIATL